MLFIIASIVFFLLSIRWILLWTYFWQKHAYNLRSVIASIKQLSLSTFLWHIICPAILLFLIFLYSGVIFNDALTSIYHVIVALVFVTFLAGISLKLHSGSVKLPQFSLKALAISLVTTFLVSFLYMIPLVDTFLWLVILSLIIPLLIALLVALLAFPTEIYEDFIAERTKDAMPRKHSIFVALVGTKSAVVKAYAGSVFKRNTHIYVEQATGFVQLTHSLRNNATGEKRVYVFEMPSMQEDRVKIASITKPAIIIITNDIKDERAYKDLVHLLPRNVTVLSYKKNVVFNHLAKKNHKHILLFGLQKSPIKRGVDIFGYDVEEDEKGITMIINVQGKINVYKNLKISLEELPYVLPIMYLKKLRSL